MKKLKIKLLRYFRTPSRARVSRDIRNYNKDGISTNWIHEGNKLG
jgi:hypothetical protein